MVEVWWRDDDVGETSTATARFIEHVERWCLPVAMAAIPSRLEDETAALLNECDWVAVLQHGWSHEDHSQGRRKKIELGGAVDRSVLEADLRRGLDLLQEKAGESFLPIMVPPWNRIDEDVIAMLGRGPWTGLSTFAARSSDGPNGSYLINTHVDLIDWRGSGRQKPINELRKEFELVCGLNEPIGILSHHLVMSQTDLEELGEFLGGIAGSHDVRFASIMDLSAAGR